MNPVQPHDPNIRANQIFALFFNSLYYLAPYIPQILTRAIECVIT